MGAQVEKMLYIPTKTRRQRQALSPTLPLPLSPRLLQTQHEQRPKSNICGRPREKTGGSENNFNDALDVKLQIFSDEQMDVARPVENATSVEGLFKFAEPECALPQCAWPWSWGYGCCCEEVEVWYEVCWGLECEGWR